VERTYKITDFGSLQQGEVGDARIGTPLYLPPEMLFDDESKYDQKIDVWSLGVSLF
jgi:serine/threonine protein kinase